ncbi:hypothetical protein MMC24_007800, partial [Lignoscripta atroalba]|nr:hypothetical protein [Lignoscripta atroalba]
MSTRPNLKRKRSSSPFTPIEQPDNTVSAEHVNDSRHFDLSCATVHPSEDSPPILALSRSNLRLLDKMTGTAPPVTPSDGKSKSGKSGSHQVQNLEEQ